MSEEQAAPTTEQQPPSKSPSQLAAEFFGTGFKGEVKPPEERPPEEDQAGEGAGQEAENAEVTTETEAEGTDAERVEASKEGSDEVPISSVQELVEHNGWEPDWFNSLEVPITVDRKPGKTTIAELVKNYQIGSAAEHRLEEARAKVQATNKEIEESKGALQTQFAVAAEVIKAAEQLLDIETSETNWQELRVNDPEQFLLLKDSMGERRKALDTIKRNAAEKFQKAVEDNTKKLEGERATYVQEQNTILLDKMPDWRDGTKLQADMAKLGQYLSKQGFTREDIVGASDHRLILTAFKAMLYDELTSSNKAAGKKLVTVPKVVKPGTPKPQDQISKERIATHQTRLRETGSLDAAVALLQAKRGGK